MIISVLVFVIVIVAHEFAHGYVAYRLGDTTARDQGRLTLNPLAHADPVGTVLLPVLLIISHSPVVFGWAKPVPVNPYNFANPRKGMLLTSLAGPAANFVLALFFAGIFKLGIFPVYSTGWTFLLAGVMISLILGIFNLVPIPPLDGANIIMAIIPKKAAAQYVRMQKYGFIILIALLYFGLFDHVILPLVRIFTHALLG
ncbi:MAG: site-2 protease family protein [Candidatus Aadella gelida]|nr:site-2 protease family protein [Candidatus Aadella gelida]